MARNITITLDDGSTHTYQNAPDTVTPEQVQARAEKEFGKGVTNIDGGNKTNKLANVEAPNFIERNLAKLPDIISPDTQSKLKSFVAGMADPSVGIAQLGANLIGKGKPVNKAIANKENEINAERRSVGRTGADAYRMAGNVASPTNLIIASKFPAVASTAGRVLQGAEIGAIGGASAPVTSGDEYAKNKTLQVAGGTVGGAVLTPIAGKIGDFAGNIVNKILLKKTPATVSQVDIDNAINTALQEVKQTVNDVDPQVLASLRQQVQDSLKVGNKLDASAALRKADFDSLGMPSLSGQITRDPNKFAQEMNMRGVAGVGEPIQARMNQQAQILQNKVGAFKNGALEPYQAGVQLDNTLKNVDESLRKNVTNLYKQARTSTGKDLEIPLQGLAQDYAEVLNNFGDKVPSGVRNQFRQLGLEDGKQLKTFTVESTDKLLKVINDNMGSDKATNTALSQLRDAVKNSVLNIDANGGVYAPAVKAARERFNLQDAIPALKAASNGDVAPDDFVKKFVINGKTDEVNKLANLLKNSDPASYDQARAQIGASLYKAAFGNNAAGDKAMAAERFSTELNKYGTNKLKAFFTDSEISQMKTIERVAAYKSSTPSNAAVNYSNSASAVANLLKRIPGVPAAVSLADAAKTTINNASAVNSSVAAKIPSTPINNPRVSNTISRILTGGTLGLSSGSIRQ